MEQVATRDFDLALNQVATVASLSFGRRDLVALHAGLVLQTLDVLRRGATPEEIADSIRDRLAIGIEIGNVVDTVGRLLDSGEIVRSQDFQVSLHSDVRASLEKQHRTAAMQRRAVTAEWIDSIDSVLTSRNDDPLTPLQRVQLESDLDIFLGQLLRYHGAEVAYFLYPSSSAVQASLALDDTNLYSELPTIDDILNQLRREFLPRFVREATAERASYIADRLHRAFLLQVLQVDASASSLFVEVIEPKELFLDTNFVFRAMGMQGDVLRNSAREVIRLSIATGHSLKLTARTLQELDYVVKQQSDWIAKGPEVPEYLAGVASDFVAKNDYVSSYWKDRLRSGITAAQFQERFSNIQLQLENLGIDIFTAAPRDIPNPAAVAIEVQALRRYKPTANIRVVEHDAYHKEFVEQRRVLKKGREPFGWYEASDLFLTFDNSLPPYAAARAGGGHGQRLPFCLMANEWLQLLYFIRPDVDISPRTFVTLINSPYLESYFSATAVDRELVRRVVCTMAELGEYRPEVARKLFVDRLLRKRLDAAQGKEQAEIIRDAVGVESRAEDDRLGKLLAEKEQRIRDLESAAARVQPARPATSVTKTRDRRGVVRRDTDGTAALREELAALRRELTATRQLKNDVQELRSRVDKASSGARASQRWLMLFPVALVMIGVFNAVAGGATVRLGLVEIVFGVTPFVIGIWKQFEGRTWELVNRAAALVTIGIALWDHSPEARNAVKAIGAVIARVVGGG